jgi:hypothetical protein
MDEAQVHCEIVAMLEILNNLLVLTLQAHRKASFLPFRLETFYWPIARLFEDGFLYADESASQFGIIKMTPHAIIFGLERHGFKSLAASNLWFCFRDRLHVGVKVPQEASLAKVRKGLEESVVFVIERVITVIILGYILALTWLGCSVRLNAQ